MASLIKTVIVSFEHGRSLLLDTQYPCDRNYILLKRTILIQQLSCWSKSYEDYIDLLQDKTLHLTTFRQTKNSKVPFNSSNWIIIELPISYSFQNIYCFQILILGRVCTGGRNNWVDGVDYTFGLGKTPKVWTAANCARTIDQWHLLVWIVKRRLSLLRYIITRSISTQKLPEDHHFLEFLVKREKKSK